MPSSKEGVPGKKPAGIKPKTPSSKPRESSLERHRQSYIRAWHAINQAKQDTGPAIEEASKQSKGPQTESSASNPLQRSQSEATPGPLTARSADVHDKASGSRKRRKEPQKEPPGGLEIQPNPSSIEKAAARRQKWKALKTPEPAKPDSPGTPSDDESSQASGDGLFVTPNPKTTREKSTSRGPSAQVTQHPIHPVRLIPYPKRKSRRDLAFVFNAPDSAYVGGISKESLKIASRATFGPKSVRKVQQSSPGVWLVRLRSQEDARDGVGKKLVIGGVEVAAEKIPKIPSKMFVWKLGEMDGMPSNKEVADRVRQTFNWPLPDVKVEGSARQVTLAFSQFPELLRFYLLLDSGVEARFDPVFSSR